LGTWLSCERAILTSADARMLSEDRALRVWREQVRCRRAWAGKRADSSHRGSFEAGGEVQGGPGPCPESRKSAEVFHRKVGAAHRPYRGLRRPQRGPRSPHNPDGKSVFGVSGPSRTLGFPRSQCRPALGNDVLGREFDELTSVCFGQSEIDFAAQGVERQAGEIPFSLKPRHRRVDRVRGRIITTRLDLIVDKLLQFGFEQDIHGHSP